MIDTNQPDYAITPAGECRPQYVYQPRSTDAPELSIITPYYNVGPVFWETVRAVQRMSFANWEWLLVDDGSTSAESLAQLDQLAAMDARVRVIHQPNGGPAVARNTAVAQARGRYLLQVDADDLFEPTFVEKAIWVLETQPQFAACNGLNVTFGTKNFLWPYGFHNYEENIGENKVAIIAVIRKDAWQRVGGYDESISYEHADWDFWLNLADAGLWGYTIQEYLVWYRTQQTSLLVEIENDMRRSERFRKWLHTKHKGLRDRFPYPVWSSRATPDDFAYPPSVPVANPLTKPAGTKRALLLAPWLEMGGADKFNLDLIETLSRQGYECTVATTARSRDPWHHRFTSLTPDVFCLHDFLRPVDYPRFLDYLIESRQIETVLVSNSEFAYQLAPYLRARHPNVVLLDYNHSEEEEWRDGGYPAYAVESGRVFDLNLTCTEHLKRWMVARGADAERVDVVYCDVDTDVWRPDRYDRHAARTRLGIPDDLPLVLWTGRMVDVKRPMLLLRILKELSAQEPRFQALIVGSGPYLAKMRTYIAQHKLDRHVRLLGSRPAEEVRELMAAGDIFLLPSEREGLALVLYESMAMEMVPVTAQVGGHDELVTPECGIVVPRSDREVEDYVQALARLLREPATRQRMAEESRRRVVERFDIRRLAGDMTAALDRAAMLAAESRGPVPSPDEARTAMRTAVEYLYQMEAAELALAESGKLSPRLRARHLRERYLPIGSAGYRRYKRVRQGVRRAIHLVRSMPRYVRTGKVRQVPVYIAARLTAGAGARR